LRTCRFSEFLHRPGAAADRLDVVRALRLRRRDAGDLVLMRVEHLERDSVVVDLTARSICGSPTPVPLMAGTNWPRRLPATIARSLSRLVAPCACP
jgi:hypothetical protein